MDRNDACKSSMILRNFGSGSVFILAHLVYQRKSLHNHALSVIVSVAVAASVAVVVCVQSS